MIPLSLWLFFTFQTAAPGERGVVATLVDIARQIRHQEPDAPFAAALAWISDRHQKTGGLTGGALESYYGTSLETAGVAPVREYVAQRLLGVRTGKILPEEVSRLLLNMAETIETMPAKPGSEPVEDRVSLQALALLARYHSNKSMAAANLALFNATGCESALQGAEARAAAALEIWRRLSTLHDSAGRRPAIFGSRPPTPENDLAVAQFDAERLRGDRALFQRYGVFDLGLEFGPEPLHSGGSTGSPSAVTSRESRLRPLDASMTYSLARGYGWREASGIAASPPLREPSLSDPRHFRGFLRGTRRSTLVADLADGDYRITAIVTNAPDLAGGSFQIRAVGGGSTGPAISYRAGEYGEKRVDARVAGGQLTLDFIPETGKDWLLAGLVFTRRAPHIAHIPLQAVTAGTRTTVAVTVTAPDGVRNATILQTVPSQAKPITIDLASDESQFCAELSWRAEWAGKKVLYHIIAEDDAGNVSRLPADGDFVVSVTR